MSQADSLRMVAEVVDKFSAPLKGLQSMLRGIGDGNRVKNLQKDFDGVQHAVSKVSGEVKNVLAPALASVGVAGLSVSGALLGIGAALRSFAGNTAQLSLLSREVGISAQKLREFGALGSRFGLDEGTMQGAARSFAENLRNMRLGYGDTLNWLSQQGRNGSERSIFRQFAVDLSKSKDNAEAFERALEFLSKIPDGVEKGMLAEKLFGNRALGLLGTENIKKALDEIRKEFGKPLTRGAEKDALAFQRSLDSVRNSLLGIRDAIGSDTLGKITPMLNSLKEYIQINREGISTGIADSVKEFAGALKDTDWRAIGGGIAEIGKAFSDVAGFLRDIQKLRNGDWSGLGFEVKEGGLFNSSPTDRQKLGDAYKRRDEADKRLRENEGMSGPAVEGMKRGREAIDREIKQLEDRLSRPQPGQPGAPANQKIGALEQRQSTEEGTKKGVLSALREFMFSKTALDGGDQKYGGAKMQPASLGGAPSSRGGTTSGASATGGTAGDPTDSPPAPYIPRFGPRSMAGRVGQAPGVSATRRALQGEPAGGKNLHELIRREAERAGIDPRIMYGIHAGESGHGNRYDKKDDRVESSWGPFQLNRRKGLGVEFERDTAEMRNRMGLGDLRDPRTIPLQAQWVANYIKKHGMRGVTGNWFGYHGNRDWDSRWGNAGYTPAGPPTNSAGQGDRSTVRSWPGDWRRATGPHTAMGGVPTPGGMSAFTEEPLGTAGDPQIQPDFARNGLDAFRGSYGRRGQLLDRMRESGLAGAPDVNANGTIHLHVEGPKGTKVRTRNEGDLFQNVHMHRGSTSPYGSGEDV